MMKKFFALVFTSWMHSLTINVQFTKGQDCSGCSNTDSCVDFLGNGKVLGCYGTFSGGMESSGVDSICGDGYQVSNISFALDNYGFSSDDCEEASENELFFFRESGTGTLCNSAFGGSLTKNVWACSGSTGGTGSTFDGTCISGNCQNVANFRCEDDNLVIDGNTIIGGLDTSDGYLNVELNDASYGGVVCAKSITSVTTPAPTTDPNAKVYMTCGIGGDPIMSTFDGTRYVYNFALTHGVDAVAPCNRNDHTFETGLPFVITTRGQHGNRHHLIITVTYITYVSIYDANGDLAYIIVMRHYWAKVRGPDIYIRYPSNLAGWRPRANQIFYVDRDKPYYWYVKRVGRSGGVEMMFADRLVRVMAGSWNLQIIMSQSWRSGNVTCGSCGLASANRYDDFQRFLRSTVTTQGMSRNAKNGRILAMSWCNGDFSKARLCPNTWATNSRRMLLADDGNSITFDNETYHVSNETTNSSITYLLVLWYSRYHDLACCI